MCTEQIQEWLPTLFTWTVIWLHQEGEEMKPKNSNKVDYISNKHWDFQLGEILSKFWHESICPWALYCTGTSYPLVSYVNQKMKTRPNDPKEMKHICFAHYISLLTLRCLAFPVPCVWSWELGTDMRLRSQGEAKFSVSWWTHWDWGQITWAKDTQVWHLCQ